MAIKLCRDNEGLKLLEKQELTTFNAAFHGSKDMNVDTCVVVTLSLASHAIISQKDDWKELDKASGSWGLQPSSRRIIIL